MYSRPIKVYQGIDNPIQVVVKNQDQKAVNLTGYVVQLDIQDPLAGGSLQSITVDVTNVSKGLGTAILPRDLVNSLEHRFYKLTVKLVDNANNRERPMYIDDNYGALLDLEVLPGWYESMPQTINMDEVIDAGSIAGNI